MLFGGSTMRSFRFGRLQEAIQMRNWILKVVVVVLAFSAGLSAVAQQDVASIVGTVTDAAGGVIPGAEVTLLSTKTNEAHHSKTNNSGAYSFTEVAPGDGYKITFTASGFSTFEVSGLYLGVATVRTQDAQLHPGQQTVVEVNASNQQATIDTTDATVGNNLDTKLLADLPIYDRTTPAVLFTLQPGVTLGGSTTGSRLDQGNVTIDGIDVNNFATGTPFAIVASAPVDSMQEFRATVAGELPSAGPAGGGQFQLVTKSGTNKYHGSISEYNRNADFVANSWFNNNDSLPKPNLVQNQFGGEIGGPIVKDKLFIYFNFLGNQIAQSETEQRTVPLPSYLAGNVGYITNGAACTPQSRANTTPQCIGYVSSAQVTAFDPLNQGLNPALFAEINQRYPAGNNLSQGDGINTEGFDFTTPFPTGQTVYTGRLDYVATHNISLFARLNLNRRNGTQASPEFPGDPVTDPNIDRSYSYAAGGTWVISSHMTDHFTYGKTVSNANFPTVYNPQGTNLVTYGLINSPYVSPVNAQHQIIPISLVSDDLTWQKGNHTFGFGGTFKWITSFFQDKLDFTNNSVGLGGHLPALDSAQRPMNLNDSTTAAGLYDSAFVFGLGSINTETSEYEFTAAGAPIAEGTGSIRNYRYYQYEAYAGDTWKVTPNLTLTYGVNYQFYSVPYEEHGFESIANMISADGTSSPLEASKYLADRIAQSNAGLSGNTALPLISYMPGGKANHQRGYYSPAYNNFAPRFAFAYNPSFDRKTTFNGSATMVYDRTLVDAIQFQQDQFNYLFQNTSSMIFGPAGASAATELAAQPRIMPGATPPGKGTTGFTLPAPLAPQNTPSPTEPFVFGGVPEGLALGQINEIMDPTIKTPYNFVYNFGMQHQFPAGFVMKLSYAGRLGRRLLAQEDVSQVLDFPDLASGQLFSQAFANFTTQLRAGGPAAVTPQPWFEDQVGPGATAFLASTASGIGADSFGQLGDIGDFSFELQGDGYIGPNILMPAQFAENTMYTNRGSSSYNGLLLTVQKNLSHGLQFDFNYTWSNSIDNTTLTGNQVGFGGYGIICDVVRPRECRGPSDNDERQFISSDFIYALPVGRGRTFAANTPLWLDELIGGWGISGLPYWHSGDPYSVFSDAETASAVTNAPAILIGNKADLNPHPNKMSDGAVNMFKNPNQAAADFEGPIGFNIGSRNAFRGPDYFNMDVELAKTFIIIPNKVNLKFAANAYNVLNHNSFSSFGDNSANAAEFFNLGLFGQINSSQTNSRVMQVSGRISF
jgi:Carboxypeptidase regulatory-like domain